MSTALARTLRKQPTPAERTLWHWLRHRYLGGYKFRRQHPVGPYVLDFYCAELRLCIEVDGGVHDEALRIVRDDARTDDLEARGITVLRVRNEWVREQADGCWDFIVDAVIQVVCKRTLQPEGEVRARICPSP